MKVSLSHYKYARYTASLFGIEEMYNLSKDMDYAFFASPSNIPNIDGVEIINAVKKHMLKQSYQSSLIYGDGNAVKNIAEVINNWKPTFDKILSY